MMVIQGDSRSLDFSSCQVLSPPGSGLPTRLRGFGGLPGPDGGFPKLGVPSSGVPIIRIIVYWVYIGVPYFGKLLDELLSQLLKGGVS